MHQILNFSFRLQKIAQKHLEKALEENLRIKIILEMMKIP